MVIVQRFVLNSQSFFNRSLKNAKKEVQESHGKVGLRGFVDGSREWGREGSGDCGKAAVRKAVYQNQAGTAQSAGATCHIIFLMQRLSVAVQRGNAVCVSRTFGDSLDIDVASSSLAVCLRSVSHQID